MTVTMNQQPKTRSPRSDRGTVRQTARDVHLLTWLSEMYGAPLDLIERLAGVSRPRAYGLVSRWKKAGWVKSGQVDAGPAWVWPTQSTAAAYLERKVTNWRPGLARVAHLRATAAVRLHRVGADLTRWISERELTTSQFLAKGDKPGHRPDGIEVLPDGRRIAIEVELTPKNPAAAAPDHDGRAGQLVACMGGMHAQHSRSQACGDRPVLSCSALHSKAPGLPERPGSPGAFFVPNGGVLP